MASCFRPLPHFIKLLFLGALEDRIGELKQIEESPFFVGMVFIFGRGAVKFRSSMRRIAI